MEYQGGLMKVYATGIYVMGHDKRRIMQFGRSCETLQDAFIEMYSSGVEGEEVWTIETDLDTKESKYITLTDSAYVSYFMQAKAYWKVTPYNEHYKKKVRALRSDDI
jgi:hypothetical protein